MVRINSGDLLIAPPSMLDHRFENTVLLLTHHDDEMSLALALNKKSNYRVNEILKPFKISLDSNPVLYWGGPVNPTTIWMLHDADWQIENTGKLNDDWAVTSHENMFHELQSGNWPSRYRIMCGHCAWAPGQLEGELEGIAPWDHKSSWLVAHDPDKNWLLGCDPDDLWQKATSFCGQQTVDSWMS